MVAVAPRATSKAAVSFIAVTGRILPLSDGPALNLLAPLKLSHNTG